MRARTRAGVALVLAVAACSAPRAVGERATVPFTRAFGLVFVELERPGQSPWLALLDTGANASAIDTRVAAELTSLGTTRVVGTTGTLEAELVEVAGLALGDRALPALRATRRDLAGLLAPEGRRVDMILGSDAFLGTALVLDFGAGRLEVLDRAPDANHEWVPMQIDQGIPAIPATIGGLDVALRIDTGASLFETDDVYVNVPTHVWDALRALRPELAPSAHLAGTGADGSTVQLPVVRVEGARVGPLELASVRLIVQPIAGYFAAPDAKGFVGCNYLEKLGVVALDYRGGRFGTPR